MAWKIQISGGGAATLTIQESTGDNASFSIRSVPAVDAGGNVEAVTTTIQANGDVAFVGSTPATVTSRVLAWYDRCAKTKTPVTVTVFLDGVAKWTFTPATSTGGPFIAAFSTEIDEGAGESHWRVGLTIVTSQTPAQAGGGGSGNDAIEEFSGEILRVKSPLGDVVKKVWRMAAKAKSLTEAVTFVLKFKPQNVRITEELDRSARDRTAKATWVYSGMRTKDIISIIEQPPTISGLGDRHIDGKRVKKSAGDTPPFPVLHLARRQSAIIEIRGVVRGYTKDLPLPEDHYSESEHIKRQSSDQTFGFPIPEDPLLGTFVLPFHEVYKVTGLVGPPNHGDHEGIVIIAEPTDGSILTFVKAT